MPGVDEKTKWTGCLTLLTFIHLRAEYAMAFPPLEGVRTVLPPDLAHAVDELEGYEAAAHP